MSGLMDSFATTVSVALQYGVPLRDLVNKFAHVRFEPSGFTGNQEIPIAKSIVDYIFRWLGSRFLPDDKAILGLIDRSAIVADVPARRRSPRGAAPRAAAPRRSRATHGGRWSGSRRAPPTRRPPRRGAGHRRLEAPVDEPRHGRHPPSARRRALAEPLLPDRRVAPVSPNGLVATATPTAMATAPTASGGRSRSTSGRDEGSVQAAQADAPSCADAARSWSATTVEPERAEPFGAAARTVLAHGFHSRT